jgi:hypothetical protein
MKISAGIRTARALALGLSLLALIDRVAHAECDANQVIELGKLGYRKEQIDELCSRRNNPAQMPMPQAGAPPYGLGTGCATPVGYCFLVAPAPLNSPCTCLFPLGPAAGITIP